jgi:hypothetical protein
MMMMMMIHLEAEDLNVIVHSTRACFGRMRISKLSDFGK